MDLGFSSPRMLSHLGTGRLQPHGAELLLRHSARVLQPHGAGTFWLHGTGILWLHDAGMLQPCHAGLLWSHDSEILQMFSGLMDLGCSVPMVGQERGSGVCRGDGLALSLNLRYVLLHVHCVPLAALEDEEAKVGKYRQLLAALPPVNRATLKALINHLFRYGIDPLGISLATLGSWGALGCGGALILWLMLPARKGKEFGVKPCLMPNIVSCIGVEGRGPGGTLGQES